MFRLTIFVIIVESICHIGTLSLRPVPPFPLPRPLPPICDDGGPGPQTQWKYYGEKCNNDSECFGNPFSMICQSGVCNCTEDFESSKNNAPIGQVTCVPAPSLFENCTNKCQRPAKCLPYQGNSSTEAVQSNVTICQCVAPFVFEKGICFLRCKEDEEYDEQNYKCVQKCNVDQIKINDTCYPFADLGQSCNDTEQCRQSFSYCKKGVCACRNGFSGNKSFCEPNEYVCPIGQALKDGNGPRVCHTFFEEVSEPKLPTDFVGPIIPRPPAPLKDDCPNGSFCLIPSITYPQPNQTGYCCPDVKKLCPIGHPHPTLKCGQPSPDNQYCPYKTHYCNNIAFGSYQKSACCPKGCPTDLVQIGEKCYQRVKLDGKCSFNQQCSDQNAECENGTCQCANGAKKSGGPLNFYCIKECKFDEVLRNNQCIKRKNLNDTCTQSTAYLCPANAFCSKSGRCICQCGMIKLAENVCAPKPWCNSIFGLAPTSGPGNDSIKNTTFCRVFGKEPPNGIKVSTCPHRQYCTYYISHLGQCCPKPKRQCINGQLPKPDQDCCDPQKPLSCGINYNCYKYINPVDEGPDNSNHTLCCPKSFRPGPVIID